MTVEEERNLKRKMYILENEGMVKLGARVTMTELRHFLKVRLPEFSKYLDIFASPQIKNIATVIGNVANASPIGDTPPALLALGADIHMTSKSGERVIALENFFLDYKKTALQKEELITINIF